MTTFNRRGVLGSAAILAMSVTGVAAFAQDADPVKIGYAASQTGRNAAGAGLTTIPTYELWVHDVNEAGGLTMPDGSQRPIELIAYDDRSETQEVVRAVERLATQDEVDFILPPWGTGFNMAVAPLFDRFGYPQLATTSVVLETEPLVERWPGSFWLLGTSRGYAGTIADFYAGLKESGDVNGQVALVSVADGFGIELVTEARALFEEAGLEIVMDTTYPLGTSDFSTIINEAENSGADAFVAFSYPPGTFGLSKQAALSDYNPKIFYTGVGTGFPAYPAIVDANVEGVMSLGGIDTSNQAIMDYRARQQDVVGSPPDYWGSVVVYSSLEMLAQSIERVGLDREAVSEELRTGTFDTLMGEVKFEGNTLDHIFYLGQWQGGNFVGLAPTDRAGAAEPIFPKPAWK